MECCARSACDALGCFTLGTEFCSLCKCRDVEITWEAPWRFVLRWSNGTDLRQDALGLFLDFGEFGEVIPCSGAGLSGAPSPKSTLARNLLIARSLKYPETIFATAGSRNCQLDQRCLRS